jgi:hypothetical protein
MPPVKVPERVDTARAGGQIGGMGVMRKIPGRLVLPCLLAGLAAVMAVSCGGKGARWPVPLEPAPQDVHGYAAADGCQVFAATDFTVSVCPVDWIDAEDVYSGGGRKNPFGDEVEVMSRLVFFSVKLENRSGDRLFFNPVWASLFARAAVPQAPLDVSHVYRINREAGDADERARAFRETVFDGTLSVAAGEEVQRYLVFSPPKDSFDEMTVVLQDLYHGSRDYDPAFIFLPAPVGGADN